MVAVAGGDDEAFVALHAAVAPNIYWVVRKVLRDPDQAAEIEQEALLEIWRLAPRYRDVEHIAAVSGRRRAPALEALSPLPRPGWPITWVSW